MRALYVVQKMKHALKPPIELEKAISVYSEFWSGMNLNLEPPFKDDEIKFDGSLRDLDALFYCEYEVGYPEDDYFYASLIWSQVMVNSTELRWLESISGNIAIGGPDTDYPKMIFFPHTRLLELAICSNTPQFDLFCVMTDQLLLQGVLAGYRINHLPKLYELCFSQQYSSGSGLSFTFNTLAAETRLLRMQQNRHNKPEMATPRKPYD